MKKIISMAVMLYITMTAMAQKGELAMNENIRGKENVSRNVAENTVGNTAGNRAEKEATRRQKTESGVYIRRVWRNPDYQTSV